MNCLEIQELLSTCYDGEVAADVHSVVGAHLGRCSKCAQEFAGFEKLSAMTQALKTPPPPESLWAQIEHQLDQHASNQQSLADSANCYRGWFPLTPRLFALAATMVVAVGMGSLAYHAWFAHGEHDQFAVAFGQYINEFRRDPNAAQEIFLAKYEGQRVDPRQAIQQVGYHPAVVGGLPEGYTLLATHVVKMPCCVCVQTICKRDDGSALAIFEHDDEETTEWFGDRPEITARCNDKQCCLVELDDQIAASWKRGTRQITLIGVRDVAEVGQLVAWLDENKLPTSN